MLCIELSLTSVWRLTMTKWVELIALPSKLSAYVARAFLENILSRFGVPGVVLTDKGTEFQGEFQTLLTQQKITHRIASKENPQSDGLAERMVQTLKQSLRRCLLDQTWGLPWDDCDATYWCMKQLNSTQHNHMLKLIRIIIHSLRKPI